MENYCPSCHRATESAGGQPGACEHCGHGLRLKDRWLLQGMLGHGASGYTWRGVDDAGEVVAIKELSFRRLTDLKQLELFEREAEALRGLDHPGVPRFVDHFVVEEDRFVSAYLVQEFIDGGVVKVGERTDEEEVLRFLEEMASILEHLHSRRPPVIHRDIKPSNVMRREDGSYVLIDFGAIRAAAEATMGGSTVAGTLGYMAPEQLVGRAGAVSDYYGLGATALAMLAGREAHQLIEHHRPGAWRDRVKLSSATATLLGRLLEVEEGRRMQSASGLRQAIGRVRGQSSVELAATGGAQWEEGDVQPGGGNRGPVVSMARPSMHRMIARSPIDEAREAAEREAAEREARGGAGAAEGGSKAILLVLIGAVVMLAGMAVAVGAMVLL